MIFYFCVCLVSDASESVSSNVSSALYRTCVNEVLGRRQELTGRGGLSTSPVVRRCWRGNSSALLIIIALPLRT